MQEGLQAQTSGDINSAMIKYTEAINLDPSLVAAYVNRGNIKVQKGLLDGARWDYDRAIELAPDHAGASFNLGLLAYLRSDYEAALDAYNRVIQSSPEAEHAYLNRGSVYYATGQLDAAMEDFKKVTEISPNAQDARLFRGIIYCDRGECEKALAEYADAGDDEFVALRKWLAESRLGKAEEARKNLQAYVDKFDTEHEESLEQMLLDFCLEKISEADVLESIKAKRGAYSDGVIASLYFYLGSKRILDGDKDGAIALFKLGVTTPLPMQSEYMSMKAQLAFAGGY